MLDAALLARLRTMYGEPQRRYHTLAHVEALLRWLAHWQSLAREPRLIDAAIWFHDAVYDTRRQDNEERSAALARDELGVRGWPDAAVQRVSMLVLATQQHQAEPSDADAWLFLDLDLSVLGQSAAHYTAYSDAVRAEYAWVEETAYRQGRARVLRSFLQRERIYQTPALHAAWEEAARRNLQHELDRLSPAG